MKSKVDFTEIYKFLKALTDEKFLDDLGKTIVETIIDLTQNNINVYGKPLLPYSKKYEEWKVKKGFSPNVNATLSGSMLRNVVYKVKNGKLRIYIRNTSTKDNNMKMAKHFLGDYKNWRIWAIDGLVMKAVVNKINQKMSEY